MRAIPTLRILCLAAIFGVCGCGGNGVSIRPNGYDALLATFDLANPAHGLESGTNTVTDEPQAAALLLMAESARYKWTANPEAKQRAEGAVRWLLDHPNLQSSGTIGWGLGFAWDAFSDGSVNRVWTVYGVSQAIVLEGLMDSLESGVLNSDLAAEARTAVADAVRTGDARLFDVAGGWYAYSDQAADHENVPNVNAYMAAQTQRALHLLGGSFSASETATFSAHAERARSNLEALMEPGMTWTYYPPGTPHYALNASRNDAIHHVYIVLSLLDIERFGGHATASITQASVLTSLRSFLAPGGSVYRFPAGNPGDGSAAGTPCNAWGVGALVAASARLGDDQLAQKFQAALDAYGTWPQTTQFPGGPGSSYHRTRANVLWGLGSRFR